LDAIVSPGMRRTCRAAVTRSRRPDHQSACLWITDRGTRTQRRLDGRDIGQTCPLTSTTPSSAGHTGRAAPPPLTGDASAALDPRLECSPRQPARCRASRARTAADARAPAPRWPRWRPSTARSSPDTPKMCEASGTGSPGRPWPLSQTLPGTPATWSLKHRATSRHHLGARDRRSAGRWTTVGATLMARALLAECSWPSSAVRCPTPQRAPDERAPSEPRRATEGAARSQGIVSAQRRLPLGQCDWWGGANAICFPAERISNVDDSSSAGRSSMGVTSWTRKGREPVDEVAWTTHGPRDRKTW
jgi:hypothetical protein